MGVKLDGLIIQGIIFMVGRTDQKPPDLSNSAMLVSGTDQKSEMPGSSHYREKRRQPFQKIILNLCSRFSFKYVKGEAVILKGGLVDFKPLPKTMVGRCHH